MTDCLGSGNVATFGYDSDGSLTTTTFPSGTTTSETHTYDNTDALTDTSYKIGSTATDLAALTANADELFGTTTPPVGSATSYGYDALNSVTSGTTASYTYDAASEIKSATPTGGSATDYSYSADGQLCWTGSSAPLLAPHRPPGPPSSRTAP
jgi:YD repeat-containing protein